MKSLRRQLIRYRKRITDDDYAEILLVHVARTRQNVLRQFSQHYAVLRDGGPDRPVLTATQVMNALSTESALDEKLGAGEMEPVGIAACKKAVTHVNRNKPHHGMAKQNRVGRGGANMHDNDKLFERLIRKK